MSKKRSTRRPKAADQPDLAHIAEDLRPLAEPMDRLELDPANARKHDEANLKAIASSLKQFGQRSLLVVNRKNSQIEKGNGTYLAAKKLGWTHVAVLWVEDDPASQTGFAIADNRTAELAVWDDALLQEALLEIEQATPDLYTELLLDSLRTKPDDDQPAGVDQPVPETFEIILECRDEEQQKVLFERFKKEGHKCRLLTM